MERTAVDTSVIVPALLSWHEHHVPALPVVQEALEQGALILPLPALLECFAVLTRLPAPWRLSGPDAHGLLSRTFRASPLAALEADDGWTLLDGLVG